MKSHTYTTLLFRQTATSKKKTTSLRRSLRHMQQTLPESCHTVF